MGEERGVGPHRHSKGPPDATGVGVAESRGSSVQLGGEELNRISVATSVRRRSSSEVSVCLSAIREYCCEWWSIIIESASRLPPMSNVAARERLPSWLRGDGNDHENFGIDVIGLQTSF